MSRNRYYSRNLVRHSRNYRRSPSRKSSNSSRSRKAYRSSHRRGDYEHKKIHNYKSISIHNHIKSSIRHVIKSPSNSRRIGEDSPRKRIAREVPKLIKKAKIYYKDSSSNVQVSKATNDHLKFEDWIQKENRVVNESLKDETRDYEKENHNKKRNEEQNEYFINNNKGENTTIISKEIDKKVGLKSNKEEGKINNNKTEIGLQTESQNSTEATWSNDQIKELINIILDIKQLWTQNAVSIDAINKILSNAHSEAINSSFHDASEISNKDRQSAFFWVQSEGCKSPSFGNDDDVLSNWNDFVATVFNEDDVRLESDIDAVPVIKAIPKTRKSSKAKISDKKRKIKEKRKEDKQDKMHNSITNKKDDPNFLKNSKVNNPHKRIRKE